MTEVVMSLLKNGYRDGLGGSCVNESSLLSSTESLSHLASPTCESNMISFHGQVGNDTCYRLSWAKEFTITTPSQ